MKSDKERISELEKRVSNLEKRLDPFYDDRIKEPVVDPDWNVCKVCNLRFEGVMGYVCSNANCPSRITCT